MRTLLSAAALICGLAAAAPARAEPGPPATCVEPLALDPALIAEAQLFGLQAITSDVLVGSLRPGWSETSDVSGGVAFVRAQDGGWRGLRLAAGEDLVGAFAGPGGRLALVTMWTSEGPGRSWTLILAEASLASARCVEIPFPAELNQPFWANEFLDLEDFDLDRRGRGEIIGVARVERDGVAQDWRYAYRTRDGGRSFEAPTRLGSPRPAKGGRYAPIEPAAAGAEALLASVAGKE